MLKQPNGTLMLWGASHYETPRRGTPSTPAVHCTSSQCILHYRRPSEGHCVSRHEGGKVVNRHDVHRTMVHENTPRNVLYHCARSLTEAQGPNRGLSGPYWGHTVTNTPMVRYRGRWESPRCTPRWAKILLQGSFSAHSTSVSID